MLYEDDVVNAVVAHLRADGWEIVSTALATQPGDDIVATRHGERLIVEAKGQGSSKAHTSRYGQSFDSGQVLTHVSVAILRALHVASAGTSTAAVALPADAAHRRRVDPALPALSKVGVIVFWVEQDGGVTVQQ